MTVLSPRSGRLVPALALAVLLLGAPLASADEKGTDVPALVAPIAELPDLVLASMLPATTERDDVVAAAAWLDAGEGPVDCVPTDNDWDPSVRALLQFPDVLRWMRANDTWTRDLGARVATRPADVLAAIQARRAKAHAAGTLKSGAGLDVVVNTIEFDSVIEILPAAKTGIRRAWKQHAIRWGGGPWRGQ